MAPPTNLQQLIDSIAYPGQPGPEGDVIREWLRAEGALYDRIEFDVHVGAGGEVQPGIPENIARAWTRSTQKRIDVVAWQGNRVTLIEAKVKLNMGVMGQLFGYGFLWLADHNNAPISEYVAIARRGDPDVIGALNAAGVRVELFKDLPPLPANSVSPQEP